MATIRNRLGKIHMFTRGRDFGVPEYLAEKGLDVNVHFQGAGKTSFFIDGPTVYAFSSGEWGNILADVAGSNRWIEHEISGTMSTENPNASYPRLSYGLSLIHI